VSGAWASNVYTISGTPTSADTYNYTVTTTNNKGCANPSATGKITVTLPPPITYTGCTAPSLTLGTVGFTSSQTYPRNGLTISSPVTATYCNTRTYSSYDGGSSGAYKADCATNYYSATRGNWFAWCMVKQFASQLCPSPWRVPTQADLCQFVNNSPYDCSSYTGFLYSDVGDWLTGYVNSGSYDGSPYILWQTSTEDDSNRAYSLYYNGANTILQNSVTKSFGFALRCVQNTP
jgi:hypothetical protein